MKNEVSPLSGVHILVTRPIKPASRTAERLGALGATPYIYPTILIEPPADAGQVKVALSLLQNVYAIIFVSPSAVEMTLKDNVKLPISIKIFAPGRGTAEELNLHGVNNLQIPLKSFDSEGLLELSDLQSELVKGQRILIFRGNGGREMLFDELRKRGAQVEAVTAYRRRIPTTSPVGLLELLKLKKITAVSMMSSSAVKNLVTLIPERDRKDVLFSLPAYASHKRIKDAAESLGFMNVTETAPGDRGLIATLLNYKN
ncbi:uroporphyrinogen-III synthase [Nitrosomonadaceae bacterium]|nr:uroporphyrinogen-III synthase [Nitrosomonadaceae bacterium]